MMKPSHASAVLAICAVAAIATPSAIAQSSSTSSAATSTSSAAESTSAAAGEQDNSDCVDVFALAVQGTGQSAPDSAPDMDTGFLGGLFSPLVGGGELAGSTSGSASAGASTADDDEQEVEGSFDREYIPYESSMAGVSTESGSNMPRAATSYKASVTGGADTLTERASEILDECPDTSLVPVGYSQGADVVDKFLAEVGNGDSSIPADAVAGGAVFGSPRRGENMDVIPGGESAPAGSEDLESITADAAGGAGILPIADHVSDYGELDGQVAQFCTEGDLVCSMPPDSPLARTVSKAVTSVDLGDGDPFKILADLGDAFALSPVQAASDVVNEDVSGDSLETVQIDPDKSISQRLEDSTSNPISSDDSADSSSGNDAGASSTGSSDADTDSDSSPSTGGSDSESSTDTSPGGSDDSSTSLPGIDDSTAGDLTGDALDAAGDAAVDGLDAAGVDERTQSVAQDASAALSKLGVMGMNSAVTVAKKTFTPENIAQVASVGLANPQAGLALLGSKVAATATEVVAPVGIEAASSAFKYAEAEVEDNQGLIQMATDVTYWNHWQNHTSYTSMPVTDEGTSAIDYTADWIRDLTTTAGKDDESDGGDTESSETSSTDAATSSGSATQTSSTDTSEPVEDSTAQTTTSEPAGEPTDDTDSDH